MTNSNDANSGDTSSGARTINDRIARLSPQQRAWLEKRLEAQRPAAVAPAAPRPAQVGPRPLSFAQQRLWFLDQLEPNNPVYNIPTVYRLLGPLNLGALEGAVNDIVSRHDALRTTFSTVDGIPVQVIAPSLHTPLPVIDLGSLPAAEREQEALQLAVQHARDPFDLSRGPLLRLNLLRLAQDDHLLVITMHHITSDAWSVAVFREELAALYAAHCHNLPSPLPDLPMQYADFAAWQRQWLSGDVLATQLAYWTKQLAGAPLFDLPTDRPRPPVQTYGGARRSVYLPAGLTQLLRALSRGAGATMFMTLLAAFDVLLYRYSGQEDIVVGAPIANRTRSDIEGLIGFFVNTLVLRADLSGDPAFSELLQRVRQTALDAYTYQDLPFERLVEELRLERSLSRTPLFQIMFDYLNVPGQSLEMEGLTTSQVAIDGGIAHFDMIVYVREESDSRINVIAEYNTDLFDGSTIDRFLTHYQTLLQGIVAGPDQRISRLPLLSAAERRQLLAGWNDTSALRPPQTCVHHLVEEQAENTPNAVAVSLAGRSLTYAELNAQADRLAAALRQRGVGRDVAVAIYMERSLDTMIALLAILKAGGACVPIDPHYPAQRASYMLDNCRAPIILTQRILRQALAARQETILVLDEQPALPDHEGGGAAEPVTPDCLCYVLYTSGSTGQPKGVAMPHASLCNLIRWQMEHTSAGARSRTTQFASLSFDVSFQEIFATWCAGGELVLVPDEVRRDPAALLLALREQSIARAFLPVVALRGLAEAAASEAVLPADLVEVVTAGEQLEITPQIRQLFTRLPTCRLCNQYGPTESHVVTAYLLPAAPDKWPDWPPIGRPIANARLYVLDAGRQPVPIGAPGDLYIGGPVLARGYLNRPDWTAERFVADPFAQTSAARMYRTGDRARFLADGNLEFLGRSDDQVKIRGFRVELGEIETALGQHPAVRECAVVARDQDPDDEAAGRATGKRLAAYLALRQAQQPTTSELRSFLQQTLPEYMTPSVFVFVDKLPLTPSGKVDRRALPAPAQRRPEMDKTYAAPRTPLEAQLAGIWADLFGVDKVGIGDDFFDLGGHSLLGIRLFARIEQELGRKLPVALLFRAPTVEQLALALHGGSPPDWSTLVPIQAAGSRPPFFCVHGFGGGVLGYAELARRLGADQPFYGLQARGIDGQTEPHRRIEDMAADYIKAMRSLQTQGPYYLGGYCYGAIVAFEMARQLEAAGQAVGLLAILEGYALSRAEARQQMRSVRKIVPMLLRTPLWLYDELRRPGGWQSLVKRLRGSARRLWPAPSSERGAAGSVDQQNLPEHLLRLQAVHLQAFANYRPQPYPGRVTLFRVHTLSLLRSYDPQMGWGRVAKGGVEVKMIPGAHYSILEKPHVAVLAAHLKSSLDEAQRHGRE